MLTELVSICRLQATDGLAFASTPGLLGDVVVPRWRFLLTRHGFDRHRLLFPRDHLTVTHRDRTDDPCQKRFASSTLHILGQQGGEIGVGAAG